MTNEGIALVKDSWAKVMPISDQAAALFYGKLFEIDPELKALFPEDMEEQGKKLMKMINTAVNGLDRLEVVIPQGKHQGVLDKGGVLISLGLQFGLSLFL